MKFKHFWCIFIFCSSASVYAEDLSKNVFITDAWVQAMPSVQRTTAAYMTITNNSQKEAVIVSASSEAAQAAEIHQMSDMNGMMHMAMAYNMHIPARGKITLAPGGFHIMLIKLKKPLSNNDIIPITLHFKDGSNIIVKAGVRDQ